MQRLWDWLDGNGGRLFAIIVGGCFAVICMAAAVVIVTVAARYVAS